MRKRQQQEFHSHQSPTQTSSLDPFAQGVDEILSRINKQVLSFKGDLIKFSGLITASLPWIGP